LVKIRFFTLIVRLWQVGEFFAFDYFTNKVLKNRFAYLALLQAWVCALTCAACKCAKCSLAEFTHVTIIF